MTLGSAKKGNAELWNLMLEVFREVMDLKELSETKKNNIFKEFMDNEHTQEKVVFLQHNEPSA